MMFVQSIVIMPTGVPRRREVWDERRGARFVLVLGGEVPIDFIVSPST